MRLSVLEQVCVVLRGDNCTGCGSNIGGLCVSQVGSNATGDVGMGAGAGADAAVCGTGGGQLGVARSSN